MKLRFLGSGSAFYPQLGSTAAYFVHNKELFLIDCGESVFERLDNEVLIESFDKIYVYITHLHSDHVGSLGSLISYCYCELHKKIYIIHPIDTIVQLLNLLGIESEFYYYLKKSPIWITDIKIIPIEVPHVKNMKSFGYIIEEQSERIYYSGDSNAIPQFILTKFLNRTIDKIYQDVCSLETEHATHCSIETLEKVIPCHLRDKVYCMHLDVYYKEKILNKGFHIVYSK